MRQSIELIPYDVNWPALAEAEGLRWLPVLGDARVHHIGSTAVQGIAAKAVIDLLPVVADIEKVQESGVRALGYQWWGEYGLAGRRFCTLNDAVTGKRLFNVHIYAEGSAEIARHLVFRDYLRAHADEAREYERVKRDAARQCPEDVLAYNDCKSTWIKGCETRAFVWKNEQSVAE